MTTPELIEYLNTQLDIRLAKILADESVTAPQLIDQLIDLSKSNLYPTNWRAAWVLDHVQQSHKAMIEPYLPRFLNHLREIKSEGVKRHYIKMLSQGSDDLLDDGRLVDFCIERLLSQQTPIAVRAHCMEILRRQTLRYPELGNELKPILEEIIENGSKGEKNKASKVLKEIGKLNR
ncbi:MAG: hypothetical protein QM786_11900 [Breznakibacter sp.]